MSSTRQEGGSGGGVVGGVGSRGLGSVQSTKRPGKIRGTAHEKDGEGYWWHASGCDYFDGDSGKEDTLRVYCHNVDNAGDGSVVKEEMELWAEGKFDVICLQDLR